MLISRNHQKGFAAFYISVLVMVVVFGIAVSIFILTYREQKIAKNITEANQAYYAAESGIEDALLRLVKNLNWSSPYKLSVGENWVTTTISSIIGGSRTITAQGNAADRVRKIQAGYAISSENVSFYYGAQIGDGGLKMSANSAIRGNVFSNGSIIPEDSGRGNIDNDVYVAYNGNKIEGVNIGGDAYAFTFTNCNVAGDIYYVSGGSVSGCPAGGTINIRPNQVDPRSMPISDSQILNWKSEAASGGVMGPINSNANLNLGPVKIEGDLRVYGNGTITIEGTIWLTGNLTFENNAEIKLSSSYYGNSGMIIADGKVLLQNNAELEGSGQPGSYLMVLGTNNSVDELSPAFWVKNNIEGDIIFYAANGLMVLENNAELREATAYKLFLRNNVEVNYQTGLQDASFSSGPGGSWEVTSWQEVE